MSVEEPSGKGQSFVSTIKVLRGMLDAAQWQALLSSLNPATRTLIDAPPHASEWIALRHENHLVDTVFKTAFGSDRERACEIGHRAFANDLNSVYRVFFKAFRPAFILSRVPQIYAAYYRNNGSAHTEDVSDKRCVIVVTGAVVRSVAWWETQRGSLHAGGAATRVKGMASRFLSGGGEGDHESRIELQWE